MLDGVTPLWSTNVRNCLNENLPERGIGRGDPQDCNITWPLRSPDMAPTDYFLYIYIKRKVYVKNYKNICDLLSAIIVSDGMVTSTMENFGRPLEMVLQK